MRLFDFLHAATPDLGPTHCKIHLASWNGVEKPLDVYLAGDFDDWQRWQSKRNFERPFVVSLIQLPQTGQWLFAGLHTSGQPVRRTHPLDQIEYNHYPLIEDARCQEFNGRLVVSFSRPGRQSYLDAETWTERILVSELYPSRIELSEFPGYRSVDISHDELVTIFQRNIDSWKAGLSAVAGIYLITDTKSGKLYVGIAHGQGGFWQRWSDYAKTGHGGNKELMQLLVTNGSAYARNFQYAVLEIADTHTLCDDLRPRETHWKRILSSRAHGLNAN
jgi:hypothetical protein